MRLRKAHLLFVSTFLLMTISLSSCQEPLDEELVDDIESSRAPFTLPIDRPPPTAPLTMEFDANADGYADLAVVSRGDVHLIYVYYGSRDGYRGTPQIIEAPNADDYFFNSLAEAGDVNGDGYSDLIVGNPYGPGGGEALIYHGGPDGLPSVATKVISSSVVGIDFSFGCTVQGARDINGDGYSDVIIAATAEPNSSGEVNAGVVYVFYGSWKGVSTFSPDRLDGTGEGNGVFGWAIATADVNNDDHTDVIVAQNRNIFDPPTTGSLGRVHVFLGGPDGISTTASQVLASINGDRTGFGQSVSSAGDFNGDGYDDVIVGADRVSTYDGRAYLYLGNFKGLDEEPVIVFRAPDGVDGFFGYAVSSGDFDGDGFSDVVVGETDALAYRGRAHVFLGEDVVRGIRPEIWSDPDYSPSGNHTSTGYFGQSLTSPGDVNNDGYDDLAVGAPSAFSGSGAVYTFISDYDFRRDPPFVIVRTRYEPLDPTEELFGVNMM